MRTPITRSSRRHARRNCRLLRHGVATGLLLGSLQAQAGILLEIINHDPDDAATPRTWYWASFRPDFLFAQTVYNGEWWWFRSPLPFSGPVRYGSANGDATILVDASATDLRVTIDCQASTGCMASVRPLEGAQARPGAIAAR